MTDLRTRLWAHLVCHDAAPWEYKVLRLCREFHCTPRELLGHADREVLSAIFVCVDVEEKVRRFRERAEQGKL